MFNVQIYLWRITILLNRKELIDLDHKSVILVDYIRSWCGLSEGARFFQNRYFPWRQNREERIHFEKPQTRILNTRDVRKYYTGCQKHGHGVCCSLEFSAIYHLCVLVSVLLPKDYSSACMTAICQIWCTNWISI